VAAILVGECDCQTQFRKRTIQWLFHQSLVLIELLVPDKKMQLWSRWAITGSWEPLVSPTFPKAKFRKKILFIQTNSFIIFTCPVFIMAVSNLFISDKWPKIIYLFGKNWKVIFCGLFEREVGVVLIQIFIVCELLARAICTISI
jgi:hypothetical protein